VSRGQLGRPPQYDPADTDPSLGVADRARPVSSGAVAVNAGERYSCAQMDSGTVQCWGSRRDGRLGDGSAHITFTPVTVAGP